MISVLVPGDPTAVVTVAMGEDSAVTNSYDCAVPASASDTAAATDHALERAAILEAAFPVRRDAARIKSEALETTCR